MGTDPFKKSWWFLEAHDGSWLADRDHELFTRDPNKALKWPNFTDADQARRALHQPLWHRIRAPTEHVFVDLEAPTPPPVPAVTREEIARIIDPSSWAVFDGYLAEVKRKYAGQNTAYDPDAFKDSRSLALADKILSRLTAGQPTETET